MSQMIIIELRWPGAWLAGSLDEHERGQATSLLHLMESRLFEAALALDLFERTRIGEPWPSATDAEVEQANWQRESEERRRIEDSLRAQLPAELTVEERWQAERSLYEQSRRVQQHRKWQAGEIPRQYLHHLPFMHARSFLTALDSIAQGVDQMIREGWESQRLSQIASAWQRNVPNVRAVRNTSAHENERALGRGPSGKTITLHPVENELISAEGGGVLVLNSLNNNRYGCTLADGHYGEVEVSADSLQATAQLVQGTLDAFEWTGPERWSPSA